MTTCNGAELKFNLWGQKLFLGASLLHLLDTNEPSHAKKGGQLPLLGYNFGATDKVHFSYSYNLYRTWMTLNKNFFFRLT